LRTTFHLYGKYLESLGDTVNAIKQYEQAETFRYEVPRMLFEAENLDDLESYIDNMKDKVPPGHIDVTLLSANFVGASGVVGKVCGK
jgi:hypothetical protein